MDSTTPVLLMLAGANPNVALTCISQARARGLRIWLTDTAENLGHAPDIVAAADRVDILSYRDRDACVAWSREQARSTPFIGVYGSGEFSVEAVAAVAEALNLPGNPPQAIERIRDKRLCREALRKRGFRQPEVRLCSNLEDARSFMVEYPASSWIIKPPAASGSVGVSLIHCLDELESAVTYLKRACKTLDQKFREQGAGAGNPRQRADLPFLIECFQPGAEYSAEGVFVHGQPHVLALTAKTTPGPPHFVEIGHAMPAELALDVQQKIKDVVEAALLALDLRWGQFHVEFWLDEGQVVLGEVHARLGGDQIHFMLQHTTGVEFYGLLFDQLLGRTIDITRYQPYRGAAIRFLTPSPGHVTALHGWEAMVSDPNCLHAQLKIAVGDYVRPLRSSLDRPGFIVASGITTQEAIQNTTRLASGVRIVVREEQTSQA